MSYQINTWQGEFGDAYTERNVVDWRTRMPAFRTMLTDLALERVLEIGCNRGHNLLSIDAILQESLSADESDLMGIEPNHRAREIARSCSTKIGVLNGTAFDIPLKDGYVDLVFTAGVLIHIDLADLPSALAEIYRVSRRYILAIEYFSEEETIIHYRGHDNLLWKRDFLKHFLTLFPDLQLCRQGYWGAEDGFDRSHWWLLKKPRQDINP